jgi:hypothetical protein
VCRLVVEEQEGAGIGGTRVGEGVVGCQLPIDALGPELESRSGVDPSNPIGFDLAIGWWHPSSVPQPSPSAGRVPASFPQPLQIGTGQPPGERVELLQTA